MLEMVHKLDINVKQCYNFHYFSVTRSLHSSLELEAIKNFPSGMKGGEAQISVNIGNVIV